MKFLTCLVSGVAIILLTLTYCNGTFANKQKDEKLRRNEYYRSSSEADVTLEDEPEDTIEEEIEKLGSNLNAYFKNSDLDRGKEERPAEGQVSAVIPAEEEEELVLASTLSGHLYALSRSTGQVKWSLDRGPAIRAPTTHMTQADATFLPDPSDGSLYMLGGPGRDTLRKLPFTVQDLVTASPCRSSEGLLYTGKKEDGWLAVDRVTGQVQEEITAEGSQRSCPVNSPKTIFIGRTEYTISMHDSKANAKRWNITYTQYSALEMPADLREKYSLTHFTTTSSGKVMTFNRETGDHLWQTELDSPVVAVYALMFNVLYAVHHTTVATETLRAITDDVTEARQLVPTLYIGEHKHGLYALPSLVDSSTVSVITRQSRRPLIEGPRDGGDSGQSGSYFKLHDQSGQPERKPKVMLIGHYDVPNVTRSELTPLAPPPPTTAQGPVVGERVTPTSYLPPAWTEAQAQPPPPPRDWLWLWTQVTSGNTSLLLSPREWRALAVELTSDPGGAASDRAVFVLGVLLAAVVTVALLRWRDRSRAPPPWSTGPGSGGSSRGSSQRHVTAEALELENGIIKVGNITFDSDQCIGKGCEGTFVFRGWFDSRNVAVKRLLPECFTFADREVALLRESDQHPNVIRYFCTEQDRQFRYIALELCLANVQDYVQGRYQGPEIAPRHILEQATAGLAHLHKLNIVHRDIKPHNVLLAERPDGAVAMISDFGLCKKLSRDRTSFSRRSGVAGTEGWIAPEMADGEGRATCSVDVFSLGCVFYYVLSPGQHPFGESFRRQYNILSGEFSLTSVPDVTVTSLVRRMINTEPERRPPVAAVLAHPMFWTPHSVLHFFQDVSDRIEKESPDSELVRRLERRGWEVHGGNWRDRIDSFIVDDLGKFRSYRSSSVRDLLRALRNKRSHYRELPEEARAALGSIPDQFVNYWTSRFPRLLMHTWSATQCVRHEHVFSKYYVGDFDWTLEPDPSAVPPWRRSPAAGASPGQSPSPRRRSGRGRGGRTAGRAAEQPGTPLLQGSQPGISLIGALLETDARNREPDERAIEDPSSEAVAEAVRRRLVDIVQEGGTVLEEADKIVARRRSLTPGRGVEEEAPAEGGEGEPDVSADVGDREVADDMGTDPVN